MLCRVADDLFWMGRYVERAISVSRLIDVTRHLELDAGSADFWAPLIGDVETAQPADVSRFLTSDEGNPGSLVSCVREARGLARGVRESISSDMWEELNTLHFSLARTGVGRQGEVDATSSHRVIGRRLQQLQGLADATLAHDEPWHFVELGTYLERADNVTRLLIRQSHLLERTDAGDDTVRQLAVLRSCGSAEAYARYYSLRVEPARVVEFLLLNPVFPQSVRFSLDAAARALGAIAALRSAAGNDPGAAVRTLGRVHAEIAHSAVDEIFDAGLERFLTRVQNGIAAASDELTATYLRDQPRPARLAGVARAAVLMAEQQQQ
ncbi:MAG: alpha-E domain-containing protein [Candidatus Limnocylindria bacterium]